MESNEFNAAELKPGSVISLEMDEVTVAVFNIDGNYFAIEDYCPHAGAPLSEGELEGKILTCPWHGSRFDVTTGELVRGPAREAVQSYKVVVEGEVGRVEA